MLPTWSLNCCGRGFGVRRRAPGVDGGGRDALRARIGPGSPRSPPPSTLPGRAVGLAAAAPPRSAGDPRPRWPVRNAGRGSGRQCRLRLRAVCLPPARSPRPRLPRVSTEKLYLIRLRNPLGRQEWSGPWSEISEEWQQLTAADRKNLGIVMSDDGEFWMSLEDFCRNFHELNVCRNVNNPVFGPKELESVVGCWTVNDDPLMNRSGGCYNNRDTFLQNPQYIFTVPEDGHKVIMSLQQKDMRTYRRMGRPDNYIIGFELFKVELNRKFRLHHLYIQERAGTSTYIDTRTVFLSKYLKKGNYVLVPTMFQHGRTSEFLLRIFCEVPVQLRELTMDMPKMSCWNLARGYPKVVTQITVHSAEGLEKKYANETVNPYLIIKCGKEEVRSPVQKNTVHAIFDTQAIFYRRTTDIPIIVQVWNKRKFRDQFLGQVTLDADPSDCRELKSLYLRKKGGPTAKVKQGHISFKVISSDDLTEL